MIKSSILGIIDTTYVALDVKLVKDLLISSPDNNTILELFSIQE